VLKLALIVAFIVAGFAFGTRQPISFAPSSADPAQIISAPFAISLVFVMYSYAGWNAATYIIGEIKDPQRSLPLALLNGTLIVIVLYVALNAVFLYTTPISAMAGKLDVAMIAGTHIFGERGGQVVGALISLGLIASISAMIWIGPRVAMTMGEDFPALRIFARRSANGAPQVAILFNALVATALLFTQSFETVLDFIQFGLLCCSALTVAGVIVLRTTQPDLPRPYRAWGYPVTPLIFLAVMAFILYYLAVNRPLQSLAGFAIMLSGLIVYALAASHAARTPAKDMVTPK
jgi:APA family basic amino acid/polyamine antiporter